MGKNKILLVDDDPELSKLLQEALESFGCEVKLCAGGAEVVGLLRSYKPDLLVMDVMLPGLDGYSLITRIAGDPNLCEVPVVVMSALTTSRCMFETFSQVIAFFSKPFNVEDLIEKVKTALAKKSK